MAQSVVIGLPISGNENASYQPEFKSYSTNINYRIGLILLAILNSPTFLLTFYLPINKNKKPQG